MSQRRQRASFREHLASPAQKVVAVAAGITTLIGVPLAINALVETFWRDDSPATPRSATLRVMRPEDIGLTWGEFITEHPNEVPRSRASYSPAQLGVFGLVLPVRVTTTGLAGKTATLRWTVVNPSGAAGNYDPPSWVPQRREIRSSSSPAIITALVWVPPAPKLDEQIVRFSLLEDRDELDREDSEELSIEPG